MQESTIVVREANIFPGGLRPDGTAWSMELLDCDCRLADLQVVGVFGLYVLDGKLLIVENDRGWEIPGGHVEPGESAEQALNREMLEEADFIVSNQMLSFSLKTNFLHSEPSCMQVFVVEGRFSAAEFCPLFETTGRMFVPLSDFPQIYRGACPELMKHIVERLAVERSSVKS